jgi:hypothetical protein
MSERGRVADRERVMSSSDRGEDQVKQNQQGERILAPTRRPDGTLRKQVRIRAGYTPQDEVAIYQPKPALVCFFSFYKVSIFNINFQTPIKIS